MINHLSRSQSAQGFTLIELIVAMSLLALGVAGAAQLRHMAFEHLSLSQQIQEASYLADAHLNALADTLEIDAGVQSGEYLRGIDQAGFPWEMDLVKLDEQLLAPSVSSLSEKVRPFKVNLRVWIDNGRRQLNFNTLILAHPEIGRDEVQPPFQLQGGER